MFSEEKIAYIQSQHLDRLATVASDGQPDVVSVGFKFDGDLFYIGGMNPAGTRRHKNILDGNTQVALILDDLESVDPWKPRGIRMYGTAEIVERAGRTGPRVSHKITPVVSWSWSIVGPAMVAGKFTPHKVYHQR